MRRRAELHAGLVAWQKMKKADKKREGFRYFGVGRKKLRGVVVEANPSEEKG